MDLVQSLTVKVEETSFVFIHRFMFLQALLAYR